MSILTDSPMAREIRMKLWHAMEKSDPQGEQGTFSDPADLPPVHSTQWETEEREAFTSPEMDRFRESLRDGDRTVRESLLDDLATYHGITPQEARDFCLHWEQKSVEEWASTGASTSDAGRVEFYRTTQSWSFDLTWWAYLQSECRTAPSTVLALRFLQQYSPGRRHLDFGSGVGVTSQLFNRSGWRSTSADLSSTLLDFARHRHERRGDDVAYIDLLTDGLPAGNYDAITAIDTLAHVPDMFDTCRRLHGALGRDGVLVANFDIRSPAPETAWHLYRDELRPLYDLRRAGFSPIGDIGYGMVAYRKVRNQGAGHALRVARDWLALVSPPRRLARSASRPLLRGLVAIRRRTRRA